MTVLAQVPDPEGTFHVTTDDSLKGRGAWDNLGMGSWANGTYEINPPGTRRIGSAVDLNLNRWCAGGGSAAIADRLHVLGYLPALSDTERGLYGDKMTGGVAAFQKDHLDVLHVSGKVGDQTSLALFGPLIAEAEKRHGIPYRLLRGEVRHESSMDPGAVGPSIYYGTVKEYRGVDRGLCQINSKYHPDVTWQQAFDPPFAIEWSAKSMADRHASYVKRYPSIDSDVAWDAAVCYHNSEVWGDAWAALNHAPNDQAAAYVAAVKAARGPA